MKIWEKITMANNYLWEAERDLKIQSSTPKVINATESEA